MNKKVFSLLIFIFATVGCSEEESNEDPQLEVACSLENIAGAWSLARVTCDSVETGSFANQNLFYDSESSVFSSQIGASSCQAQQNWNLNLGPSNLLSLEGSSQQLCLANSLSLASCTGDSLQCDFQSSFANDSQSFDSCAVREGQLILSRTASNGNSALPFQVCSEGQVEIFEYQYQGADRPTAVSVSEAQVDLDLSSPYTLPTISVNNTYVQSISLTNSGESEALALSATLSDSRFQFEGGSYPGTSGTCGSVLESEQSCTLSLSFTPDQTGLFSNTLSIVYHSGAALVEETLEITGQALPSLGHLSLTGESFHDFGQIQAGLESGRQTFEFENTGEGTVTFQGSSGLEAPFGYTNASFPGQAGTCNTTLPSGDTCLIELICAPAVADQYEDRLMVRYSNGNNSLEISIDLACESY